MGETAHNNASSISKPSRWKTYAIQIGLVFVSIAMGAAFGFVAALGMGAGSMSPIGAILGSVVGFIVSPFLLFSLTNKNDIGPGLIMVFLPTIFASLLSGAMMQAMPLAFLLPVFFFVLMTFVVRFSRDTYQEHCCQVCGYDLSVTPDRDPCSECGTPWPHCRAMRLKFAGPLDADHPCEQCGFVNRTKYQIKYCPGCGSKAMPQTTEPDDPDHSTD